MHYYRFITLTIATTFLLALSTTVSASTDTFPGSPTGNGVDKKEHKDNGNHYGTEGKPQSNGYQRRDESPGHATNGNPGSSAGGVVEGKEHQDNGNHYGTEGKPQDNGYRRRDEPASHATNGNPDSSAGGVVEGKEHQDNGNHYGTEGKPQDNGYRPLHEKVNPNANDLADGYLQREAHISTTSAEDKVNPERVSDQLRQERKEEESIIKDQNSDKYPKLGQTAGY